MGWRVQHTCHLGSEVEMRVGGDFVYDPRVGDPTTDLLLVAGGIGVNPLYSMIQHAADLLQEGATGIAVAKPRAVTLLFSAKTRQELIHRRTLQMLSEEFPTINVRLFVTQEPEAGDVNIAVGRIGEAQLRDALDGLEKSATWCYVCGPTPMIDEVETALQKLGVTKDRIRAEKWC
ncbi:PREDICTED: oxidoreductase NAD-binding domain-containing protein 1-like [Priapulus caudatus]|uniref:Oxidoreductase NAD-binding domain-containing protein 1-like n=1 Tax=Priapulus caudatus TaxID=37621 RepID=A0ABM1EQ02_PRICU|nr:PREDICTED: oxidoreductase NAD-binding domain-containing protein 1-like [Priapulus caudatus]